MAGQMLVFGPKQLRRFEMSLRAFGFTLHQARALLLLKLEIGERLAPAYNPRVDCPVRRRVDSDYPY